MLQYWGNSYGFGVASGYDADAQDYINRVIAADVAAGNSSGLEVGVQNAINTFVVACKADSIWSLLDTACIPMGARTLAGALVPLVGATPTNNGFTPADYNRKTGLGGGTSKFLAHNHTIPTGRQNNTHASVYLSATTATIEKELIMVGVEASPPFARIYYSGTGPTWLASTCMDGTFSQDTNRNGNSTGLKGVSRNNSSSYILRSGGTNYTITVPSLAYSTPITGGKVLSDGNSARVQWYSIGQALTLSTLEAKLATLASSISSAF
jgi:hypothetical protein